MPACILYVNFYVFVMFKYSRNGVSVLVVLDRRRAKKSGLYPVKVEVVYRRRQKYYPTGQDMSETEWMCFPARTSMEVAAMIDDSGGLFHEGIILYTHLINTFL